MSGEPISEPQPSVHDHTDNKKSTTHVKTTVQAPVESRDSIFKNDRKNGSVRAVVILASKTEKEKGRPREKQWPNLGLVPSSLRTSQTSLPYKVKVDDSPATKGIELGFASGRGPFYWNSKCP